MEITREQVEKGAQKALPTLIVGGLGAAAGAVAGHALKPNPATHSTVPFVAQVTSAMGAAAAGGAGVSGTVGAGAAIVTAKAAAIAATTATVATVAAPIVAGAAIGVGLVWGLGKLIDAIDKEFS